MNPTLLADALRDALDPGPITQRHAVAPHVERIETPRRRYAAKWHAATAPLEAESYGLALLSRAVSGLRIPEPLALLSDERGTVLLLEWLDAVPATPHHAEALGEGLAAQHRHCSELYGWWRNNFIGATPQDNAMSDDWPTFFAERRLVPMAERLAAAGRWSATRERSMARLLAALPSLLPAEPPASLLHGDLWGGNWLAIAEGAALIDPAPYFGDREADLGMTQLFGGFPARFYDAYHAAWPLEPEAEARVAIYNLYHLLNHLLLFGESYGAGVDAVLRPFSG